MMSESIRDGYKMTEMGELPEEWEIVKLYNYADKITSGGTPNREMKEYFLNGNISWIKTAELRDREIYNSEEKITDLGLSESSAKVFPINTVLIAMYGATIGKLGILKEKCATNQACCAIICNNNSYEYLFYYLLNSREKLISLGAGAGQPNISQGILKWFQIPLPTLPEQHRIAEILSTIDETIERTEALIEKYRHIKAGLMGDLLTRGIDEEGRIRSEETHEFKDSPLGRVPKEWRIEKIGDVLTLKGGSTPSTNNNEYWNGQIPWVVPTDITKLKSKYIADTERKITKNGLLSCSATLLPKNSILLTSRATIGFLAINKIEMATNQGFINILPSKVLLNLFLYYSMDYIKDKFILQASGSTFLELSKSTFKKFFISFPSLSEQHRIAEILTTTDTYIEKEQTYLNKLQQIKKGLMQDLLTGKVRVTTTPALPKPAEAAT